MTVLELALQLAAQGLPVFPCGANKKPAIWKDEGGNGFHDASTDPAEVGRLFSHHRAQLIGVPTGVPSGFDVLDIDPRHGGDKWWIAHRHRIPQTWAHRSRSGGLHVLFRHVEPVRNTSSKIGPGVDTRGEGGYLIWWPAHGCRVTEAPIAAWPAWLLAELFPKPRNAPPNNRPMTRLDSDDRVQRLAARMLDRVSGAAEGQRHYALRKAAFTIGGLLDRLPFSAVEAEERLLAAVTAAGAQDLNNAQRTIAWGLERGRHAPLVSGGV